MDTKNDPKPKRGGVRKNAGRKSTIDGEPMEHITATLDDMRMRKLDVLKGEGSRSEAIRKAIDLAYDRYQRT